MKNNTFTQLRIEAEKLMVETGYNKHGMRDELCKLIGIPVKRKTAVSMALNEARTSTASVKIIKDIIRVLTKLRK